jgi:hypothetical protein
MSYDLMVFDPLAPPKDRNGFMIWYEEQMMWSEEHDDSHLEVSAPSLVSWFLDMSMEFPSFDDPQNADKIDDQKLTEYSFGKSIIYTNFNWSEAENARRVMFELARKHKIGFFDVSAEDGQVWVPDANGNYRCMHGDC